MRFRSILPAILCLHFSIATQATEFHLVTESFPPLNMTNNGASYARNDRVSGFATDIVRKLFTNNGHKVSFTLMSDWDKAYTQAMESGGYGVYSTFRTEERENKFKWIGPLYEEDWVLLAPESSDLQISTLKELHNYKVGSYEFDAITDYLKEQGIPVEPAKSDAMNVVKLKLGKIQLWASSSLTGAYVAANFKIPVKPVHTFNRSSLWLAMNKETDAAIIEQLNVSLEKMRQSGEIKTMIDSYNQ